MVRTRLNDIQVFGLRSEFLKKSVSFKSTIITEIILESGRPGFPDAQLGREISKLTIESLNIIFGKVLVLVIN